MRVAVIGAGTMGSGIAQVCATSGHDVALFDADAGKVETAFASIRSSLDRFVSKDRLSSEEAAAAFGRIEVCESIGAAAEGSEVVIEAVVERLDVKHAVFAEVIEHAPRDALLGTNTSQLSITSVGAPFGAAAERLIGMHFFNPPVLMRLVELVKGLLTSEATVEAALAFAVGLGKETVVCHKDSPGFLTSRVAAIVRLECLRMLEEGVGSAADIDKALRLGLNFPMGPLELGDFNGLDMYLDVLDSLVVAHGERFRPTVTLRNLVAAGRLGRKTGRGIYRYDAGGKKLDEGEISSERGWADDLETVQVDFDGPVVWVTLNRPEAANSRNQLMRVELGAIWAGIGADERIGAVVLTAAGDRFFSAGMDLKEAAQDETPEERGARMRAGRDIEQLAAVPQPTIAAVNGYALGGGLEMALACDLRVFAEHAQVGLPELTHGLVPGGGGSQRLPRLVGPARAAELIFLGTRLTGPEALEWGIANRCVPYESLRETASELAHAVAAQPFSALRQAKALLRLCEEVPLSRGVAVELDALLALMKARAESD